MALAVLHADEVNFAGVAPIMIRTAAGDVVSIDGLGVWPRRIPADLFMREHGGTIPTGVLRTDRPRLAGRMDHRTPRPRIDDVRRGRRRGVRLARDGFAAPGYSSTAS